MMRKAAAVLTAICCLVASQVYALGLGSLILESSLNQPLRARIEIVDLGGVSPADIVVQMGSQQDFQRFNLERTNFFSDVNFTIESTSQGIFVVLTSNQSVREPYLNFILDTRWPSGRILSEHTVLLDLPVFSDGRSIAEPINQPVSPVVETEPSVERQDLVETRPAATSTSSTAESEPQPAPSATETVASENVITETPMAPGSLEVQETDTLWEVALRVRPDNSVSIQQTMLALQRLNPDAFVGGNINRLQAGETLRIPDLSQIQSISQQQAVSEVTRQNQQADLNVQPLTAPASGPSSLATGEQQGQLRVLTADEAEAAGSGASAAVEAENTALDARIEALENQLALQEEDADRSRLQQTELVARLNDLDDQIAAAVEIIRMQDQQLAQLQQSLAEAAVQASLQQEQPAMEVEQPVAAVSESQPVSTSPPSFLQSVTTVLSNNLIILIIVSVLAVCLMVMLMLRRNRAVTAEGFEVEFESGVAPDDSSEHQADEWAKGREAEPDEETVLAVAGIAGAALADVDGQESAERETDEVIGEFDSEEREESKEREEIESGFDEPVDQLAESEVDLYDLEEQTDETSVQEAALEVTSEDEAETYVSADERQEADRSASDDMTVVGEEAGSEVSGVSGSEVAEDGEPAQADEAELLDEIVDFELETEIGSEEDEEQSAEIVDFDIDEFLDEDEAVEMQSGEVQSDAAEESSDSEQSIDFELDTETEFDEQGDDEREVENTGVELEGIEYSPESDGDDVAQIDLESEGDTEDDDVAQIDLESEDDTDDDDVAQIDLESEDDTDDDDVAQIDLESEDDTDVDAELDLDTSTLEGEESDKGEEEVESLDFDLGSTGISELDEEVGTDLESVSDSEVETFDFELGAEETENEPEDELVAEDEETTDNLESVDFALSTEEASDVPSDVEERVHEEVNNFEEVEIAPENESDSEEPGEGPAVELTAEDESDMEAEATVDADLEAEIKAEIEDEIEEKIESEAEQKIAAADEIEVEAEAEVETTESDLSDSTVSELEQPAANEDVEEVVGDIELADEPDKAADEISEVLAQDEEAAAPDSEVEMGDLDFLSKDEDSAIDGAEQDSDLLSDDDEAATKLDLAYAYQKMGDVDGAKEILEEVLKEGNDAQVSEAKNLIEALQG